MVELMGTNVLANKASAEVVEGPEQLCGITKRLVVSTWGFEETEK